MGKCWANVNEEEVLLSAEEIWSRVCAVTLIYVTLSAFIFISKIYPDIIGPYVVTYKYSDHYSYLPSRRTEYVIYIESDADT